MAPSLPSARRPTLVVCATFCAFLACAGPTSEATDGITSIDASSGAAVTGDGAAGTTGGTTPASDANQGDAASGGNATRDPNAAADNNASVAAPAVDGGGFALAALDYPGYCLAATNTPANDVTLHLTSCTNDATQSFAWYKGGFALAKKYCITSPASVGAAATLRQCDASAAQVWQLSGEGNALVHTIASTSVSGQSLGLSGSVVSTANVVSLASETSQALHLAVANLPGSDGFTVHVTTDNGASEANNFCVTDVGGVLATRACVAGTDGQVWSMPANQLRAASGHCLQATASSKTLRLGDCVQNPNNAQRWYIMDFFVSLMDPNTSYSTNSLVLVPDTTLQSLSLGTATGSPTLSIGAGAFF